METDFYTDVAEPITEGIPVIRQQPEDLWDTKRLARYLGVGYDKALRMVHELSLPHSQWGGKTSPLRFRPEEVRRWVIQHELPHVEEN